MAPRAARGWAAADLGHQEFPAVRPVLDRRVHLVAAQSQVAGDVVKPGARVRGAHGVQYGAEVHSTSLPTWKTATASSQATASWRPTPNSVQRNPTSARCAASVATHGV